MSRNDSAPKSVDLNLDLTTKPKRVVKVGKPCPECGVGILDYNGLLDLECPNCGFTEGPGGGCT